MIDKDKAIMKVSLEIGLAIQELAEGHYGRAKTALWRAGDAAAKLEKIQTRPTTQNV